MLTAHSLSVSSVFLQQQDPEKNKLGQSGIHLTEAQKRKKREQEEKDAAVSQTTPSAGDPI